ncbi:MAG: 30S ribosomal protein S27ae [Methanomassiliicoccaceae archaeon]|nr:30S ribosomal protein S27ae [Methanomassiliicoccaceae archaeon]MCL2317976.1 30S ribosomal protein S27ae [Methanomassiliicoccaceae archaeon]
MADAKKPAAAPAPAAKPAPGGAKPAAGGAKPAAGGAKKDAKKPAKPKGVSKKDAYKVNNNKVERIKPTCPKCGPGIFMAAHKDRVSCGKCGYTEFKKKE